MSDSIGDYIAQAKASNPLFSVLENAIAIETELRDSATIKSILGEIRADADKALEECADTSPADTAVVMKLFVRISTLVYLRRALNTFLMRGQVAEQQIHAQNQSEGYEDE